jgi:5'-nucleotidase
MNVLLTNDDGIHAAGLLALAEELKKDHRVVIVAPEYEQSAVGHSITLADPIRVKEIAPAGEFFGWAISGTPADCVRLGASELADFEIEMVVSGINLGANVGLNVLYSGTVSAATEGAVLGLPGAAVSLDTFTDPDFGPAARFIRRLLARYADFQLGPGVSLNVNVPALPENEIKPPVWTSQCPSPAGEEFSRRTDPRGKTYFWRGRELPPQAQPQESDFAALKRGHITVTPLTFDLTHREEFLRLRSHKILD